MKNMSPQDFDVNVYRTIILNSQDLETVQIPINKIRYDLSMQKHAIQQRIGTKHRNALWPGAPDFLCLGGLIKSPYLSNLCRVKPIKENNFLRHWQYQMTRTWITLFSKYSELNCSFFHKKCSFIFLYFGRLAEETTVIHVLQISFWRSLVTEIICVCMWHTYMWQHFLRSP